MKKFFTLCLLFCVVCMGAWAEGITNLNQLSNNKVYGIRTAQNARGSLYYDSTYPGYLSATGTFWHNGSDIYSTSDDNCKFAIYKSAVTGSYYFYSIGAGQFIKSDGAHARLTDDIQQTITFTNATSDVRTTNPWVIVLNRNSTGDYLGMTNWAYYNGQSDKTPVGALTYDRNAGDAGTNMAIVEIEDISASALAAIESAVNSYEAPTIQNLINSAVAHNGQVGYPDMSSLNIYKNGGVTSENAAAAYAAYTAVVNSTEIKMPEAGKAYYIKGRYANGATKYLVHNASHSLALSDNPEAFIVGPAATNKYVLIGADNYYFAVTASGKNANVHETYDADKCAITIAHNAPNFNGSGTYTETNPSVYFGTLAIQGNCGNETFYIMSKPGGTLHNSSPSYVAYNTQSGNYLSSLFEFVEVTTEVAGETVSNPNQIKLSSPNNGGTGSLDGKCIGTFSAPYAVELPGNVTAYTADYDAARNVVVFNELGTTVPANTGVLLYAGEGEFTVKEAAVPSTASVSLGGRDNCFRPTGANGVTVDGGVNAYILSYKEGKGVKFYVLSDEDRTIARNKAYLDLTSANVSAFVFDFEDSTTGIQQIDTTRRSNTTYDLAGRNVKASQRGLYIIGGKKVIR